MHLYADPHANGGQGFDFHRGLLNTSDQVTLHSSHRLFFNGCGCCCCAEEHRRSSMLCHQPTTPVTMLAVGSHLRSRKHHKIFHVSPMTADVSPSRENGVSQSGSSVIAWSCVGQYPMNSVIQYRKVSTTPVPHTLPKFLLR